MIEFNEVPSNIADTVFRAQVPGGWLVLVTSDVVHMTDNGMQNGYDWRTSATFVPDPNHEWRI